MKWEEMKCFLRLGKTGRSDPFGLKPCTRTFPRPRLPSVGRLSKGVSCQSWKPGLDPAALEWADHSCTKRPWRLGMHERYTPAPSGCHQLFPHRSAHQEFQGRA